MSYGDNVCCYVSGGLPSDIKYVSAVPRHGLVLRPSTSFWVSHLIYNIFRDSDHRNSILHSSFDSFVALGGVGVI